MSVLVTLEKWSADYGAALPSHIESEVNGYRAGGVTWDASVLTHRRSGEEGVYGADLLIHVTLNTPQYKYSKGVLVQAKRIGPGVAMSRKPHADSSASVIPCFHIPRRRSCSLTIRTA
jgi:hypothetical protein